MEDAEVIIGVPDSGLSAAIGYAEEFAKRTGKFLYDHGFIRPHYTSRSFMEPVKEKRKAYQRIKNSVIPESVCGKNVVVVDDSIVRGNAMPFTISELRRVGAKKIYVLSVAPPMRYPCLFGVDLPTSDEFVAHGREVEDIRKVLTPDYLGYLSLEGLHQAIGRPRGEFCNGCMTGEYPVEIEKKEEESII